VAWPNGQASTDTQDAAQNSWVGAAPKVDESRRAGRRGRDAPRHSRRYRDRDNDDNTYLSSRDRGDDFRRSRNRERDSNDELSAEANPRATPPHSSNPFPFFPFFGQSW
jgi:hypothetical protein